MNIAFVNSTRKWGGVKTWMLEVGEALRDKGHNITVYGRDPSFIDKAKKMIGHGEIASFGPDIFSPATLFFSHALTKDKVEAVFVNVEKDLATAGIAAKLFGIPVIQRIGLPDDVPRRFKTQLLHKIIKPKFFCPCRYIADGFSLRLPYVKKEDIKVLLTAKNISDGQLLPHSPRQIAVSQQLNKDKGHEIILRALAGIKHPFVLHIVGTGKYEDHLRKTASDLKLDEKIIWHGFSDNVESILRQADIFLLASYSEGLPNTLLEALAHGLLPISRDVGGVSEVIEQNLKDWLLPYEAGPDDFRAIIDKALNFSDEELLSVREASRECAKKFCDMNKMIAALEDWLKNEVILQTKA